MFLIYNKITLINTLLPEQKQYIISIVKSEKAISRISDFTIIIEDTHPQLLYNLAIII